MGHRHWLQANTLMFIHLKKGKDYKNIWSRKTLDKSKYIKSLGKVYFGQAEFSLSNVNPK